MFSLISTNIPLYEPYFTVGSVYSLIGPTGSYNIQYVYRDDASKLEFFYISTQYVTNILNNTGWSIIDGLGRLHLNNKMNVVNVSNLNFSSLLTATPGFTLKITSIGSFPNGGGNWPIGLSVTRNTTLSAIAITILGATGITGTANIAVSPATTTTLNLTVLDPSTNVVSGTDIIIKAEGTGWTSYAVLKNPYGAY